MKESSTSLYRLPKNSLMVKFSVLVALWIVSFIPVFPRLVYTWLNHADNSHGILVPLISLFFVWQKRGDLKAAKISSSNWGAFILSASMFLYLLGLASGTEIISRTMVVFSLIGLLLFNLGKEVVKILFFPLLFLLFMIPVPIALQSAVAFPLQLFATKISFFFIQALSIPVYQEGNMLYFAHAQLEVAEACSGIRSISAFTVLSVVFAYLLDKGWSRRIVLLASAIPLAMFTNIIRITGTGILAHFYGSRIADSFLHEFSGIVVFAFGFILFLFEFSLLNRVRSRKSN
ncbi:MAG: Transmembrane exosortase (Exosortase_EpsH) [Syntrophorhabdus sp. PtaB.Bin027]|nr:MAG: Transmembrane exosortase (Exosortase_EpsH) [Syntrophorhabdus sp. PtaB.Bin027]OQB74685.1 MAG: Transmembrane exosortase (Exosortase_EpsH) [Deltaproteobacteria bacterium ADurb.Bin135]